MVQGRDVKIITDVIVPVPVGRTLTVNHPIPERKNGFLRMTKVSMSILRR